MWKDFLAVELPVELLVGAEWPTQIKNDSMSRNKQNAFILHNSKTIFEKYLEK